MHTISLHATFAGVIAYCLRGQTVKCEAATLIVCANGSYARRHVGTLHLARRAAPAGREFGMNSVTVRRRLLQRAWRCTCANHPA